MIPVEVQEMIDHLRKVWADRPDLDVRWTPTDRHHVYFVWAFSAPEGRIDARYVRD